jgi:hypothetical protein
MGAARPWAAFWGFGLLGARAWRFWLSAASEHSCRSWIELGAQRLEARGKGEACLGLAME